MKTRHLKSGLFALGILILGCDQSVLAPISYYTDPAASWSPTERKDNFISAYNSIPWLSGCQAVDAGFVRYEFTFEMPGDNQPGQTEDPSDDKINGSMKTFHFKDRQCQDKKKTITQSFTVSVSSAFTIANSITYNLFFSFQPVEGEIVAFESFFSPLVPNGPNDFSDGGAGFSEERQTIDITKDGQPALLWGSYGLDYQPETSVP